MRSAHPHVLVTMLLWAVGGSATAQPKLANDPLPSWNDGKAKQGIVEFVERVTNQDSGDFVPPAERIATFDNDGCLWAEQPMYFQLFFAVDRLQEMAADHPEWQTMEPFQAAIAGDLDGVMAGGMDAVAKIVAASHSNVTAEDFSAAVRKWLATAKHAETGSRYTELVYQPQLELVGYLRAKGFKTFIVSGGGVDFMRVFAEQTYGIPPEQVIGSSVAAKYELRDGVPTIIKQPEGLFVDDKQGKPVAIYQHIGRRPLFAAGNSDGDLQMLQYTTIPRSAYDTTPRLGMIIHHTDDEREWSYDRDSHVGRLDVALDEAGRRGWIIVDMKRDWNRVFPAYQKER